MIFKIPALFYPNYLLNVLLRQEGRITGEGKGPQDPEALDGVGWSVSCSCFTPQERAGTLHRRRNIRGKRFTAELRIGKFTDLHGKKQ